MGTLFDPLDDSLGTRSKVRVLRVLFADDGGVSGREAARRAGLSSRAALQALKALTALGVVNQEVTAAEHRYSVNRRHILVKHGLEQLFQSERRFPDRVFDSLQALCSGLSRESPAEVRAAWLFGSAVRGTDDPESDLDVLILADSNEGTNRLRKALAEARPDFQERFGLDLSSVVVSVERLREMDAEGASLTRDIRDHGRRVFGSTIREVLGD